jgi:hypothetical protein
LGFSDEKWSIIGGEMIHLSRNQKVIGGVLGVWVVLLLVCFTMLGHRERRFARAVRNQMQRVPTIRDPKIPVMLAERNLWFPYATLAGKHDLRLNNTGSAPVDVTLNFSPAEKDSKVQPTKFQLKVSPFAKVTTSLPIGPRNLMVVASAPILALACNSSGAGTKETVCARPLPARVAPTATVLTPDEVKAADAAAAKREATAAARGEAMKSLQDARRTLASKTRKPASKTTKPEAGR